MLTGARTFRDYPFFPADGATRDVAVQPLNREPLACRTLDEHSKAVRVKRTWGNVLTAGYREVKELLHQNRP